ncbi:hypothetical protein ACH42_12465 [Endozoicomonas sp. (ex Bugula neritina AB1)]|nr:hypothetical protein ACH42_12465 [Endozoicomonas sp. (ex Bugula neritina AB1)]
MPPILFDFIVSFIFMHFRYIYKRSIALFFSCVIHTEKPSAQLNPEIGLGFIYAQKAFEYSFTPHIIPKDYDLKEIAFPILTPHPNVDEFTGAMATFTLSPESKILPPINDRLRFATSNKSIYLLTSEEESLFEEVYIETNRCVARVSIHADGPEISRECTSNPPLTSTPYPEFFIIHILDEFGENSINLVTAFGIKKISRAEYTAIISNLFDRDLDVTLGDVIDMVHPLPYLRQRLRQRPTAQVRKTTKGAPSNNNTHPKSPPPTTSGQSQSLPPQQQSSHHINTVGSPSKSQSSFNFSPETNIERALELAGTIWGVRKSPEDEQKALFEQLKKILPEKLYTDGEGTTTSQLYPELFAGLSTTLQQLHNNPNMVDRTIQMELRNIREQMKLSFRRQPEITSTTTSTELSESLKLNIETSVLPNPSSTPFPPTRLFFFQQGEKNNLYRYEIPNPPPLLNNNEYYDENQAIMTNVNFLLKNIIPTIRRAIPTVLNWAIEQALTTFTDVELVDAFGLSETEGESVFPTVNIIHISRYPHNRVVLKIFVEISGLPLQENLRQIGHLGTIEVELKEANERIETILVRNNLLTPNAFLRRQLTGSSQAILDQLLIKITEHERNSAPNEPKVITSSRMQAIANRLNWLEKDPAWHKTKTTTPSHIQQKVLEILEEALTKTIYNPPSPQRPTNAYQKLKPFRLDHCLKEIAAAKKEPSYQEGDPLAVKVHAIIRLRQEKTDTIAESRQSESATSQNSILARSLEKSLTDEERDHIHGMKDHAFLLLAISNLKDTLLMGRFLDGLTATQRETLFALGHKPGQEIPTLAEIKKILESRDDNEKEEDSEEKEE